MTFIRKAVATAADLVRNPQKYFKALVIPAAVVVYAVSQYAGADDELTRNVITVLAALGVYKVPNKPA